MASRLREFQEHCPFHPQTKPVLYRTDAHIGKFINYYMCGHKGCTHSWEEDNTEKMGAEFNG